MPSKRLDNNRFDPSMSSAGSFEINRIRGDNLFRLGIINHNER